MHENWTSGVQPENTDRALIQSLGEAFADTSWIKEGMKTHYKALVREARERYPEIEFAGQIPLEHVYIPLAPDVSECAGRGFAELAALGGDVVPPTLVIYMGKENPHGFPLGAGMDHYIQAAKQQMAAMLMAAGRVKAFPAGLTDKGSNIAAAEDFLWQKDSALIEQNGKFDGAAYTIMLDVLGADVPADQLETARKASLAHAMLADTLKKNGDILRMCLGDHDALFFSVDRFMSGVNKHMSRGKEPDMPAFDSG